MLLDFLLAENTVHFSIQVELMSDLSFDYKSRPVALQLRLIILFR